MDKDDGKRSAFSRGVSREPSSLHVNPDGLGVSGLQPGAGLQPLAPKGALLSASKSPSFNNLSSSSMQLQQKSFGPSFPGALKPSRSALSLAAPTKLGTASGTAQTSNNYLTMAMDNVPPPADDEEDENVAYYVGGLFSIEASPAFKSLEQPKGKATLSENEELKEKIILLHKALLSCSEYEKSIQKRVKHITQEVQNQIMELDRTSNRQFELNSEIGELKRELLRSENEASLATDRVQKLTNEIEEAQKQRRELEEDIDEIRKHKTDMLEPQLIQSTKELRIDIAQRKHQVENLEKDLEEKESAYDFVLKEKERLEIEREKHAGSLAKATEMPQKILKQSEVLRDAISSLVIENVKQTTLAQQLDRELERLAHRRKELEEFKLDQASEYEKRKAEINEMEQQGDDIFKQHEFAKEQLSVQRSERVRLDLTLRGMATAIKKEHEVLLRAIRDKEIQLKIHRRLETTVNNVHTSTPTIKKQADEYASQYEQQIREDKYQRKKMAQLRKEIDLMLFEYLKQENTEKSEDEKMQAQSELNRRMESELDSVTGRSVDLERQKEALNAEKDLRSRELIRIQNKFKAIKEDISIKDLAIFDAAKRCSESLSRLRDFAALYDVVKNERNKYLNQIQATTQRAAEMKEKIKILSNEIEILRHEIMNKDRDLTRKRQDNTSAYALRDAAKNEANKLLATYRERRDQIDQHLSRIETLNTLINAAEEDMVHLKHRYEAAVKERNTVGIHLLDRNDELCILYERLNVQTNIMRKGETELQSREEEIRKLKLIATEVQRQVELGKKAKPEAEASRKELDDVKKDLETVRNEVARLSNLIESPEDPTRCRDLGGEDPSQKDLLEKIKRVEALLAEKEERLLEKDLVLEEVSTLTERLKKQTLEGRNETHEVSSKLNDLSKKIKHSTRAMMARVSELSMYQALAMSLYQEKCDKEALVEDARDKIIRGEPPTDTIEKEFIRLEKLRAKREKDIMAARERQDREKAPNYIEVIRTTAEPRPNAYLPDSSGVGELPIPRPYGAHAPFKPQEPGSQLRHFRQPKVKPIEI
ncbi:hypothetical protein BC829DRAFT_406093 [Chytridium lagenaria]|nr:hypothetical protein BC829DRAFT_406093 [Chytridium lagenaria]